MRPHHDQLGVRRGARARRSRRRGGRPASPSRSADRPPRTRSSSARSPSATRSITLLMSIGTVATSIGGGSANDASTATWTRSSGRVRRLRQRHRRRERLGRRVGKISRHQDALEGSQIHAPEASHVTGRVQPQGHRGSRAVGRRGLTGPGRMRQEGAMPKLTIAPRIRSFICLNAHPVGCAANVERGDRRRDRGSARQRAQACAGHRRQHRLRPVEPGHRGVRLRRARHRRLPRTAGPGREDRLGRLLQPRRGPAPGEGARARTSS